MTVKLNLNTVNQIVKDTVLYEENGQVSSVCLVLKGRALVYNNGIRTIMGTGSFLGISDICGGRYLSNYVAFDNMMVFVFPVSKEKDLMNVLNVNKDYHGLIISYLNKYIAEYFKVGNALRSCADKLYTFVNEKYQKYLSACKRSGHIAGPICGMEDIEQFSSDLSPDKEKIEYYMECAQIPADVQKAYFSYGTHTTLHHIKDQSRLIQELNLECVELAMYIGQYFKSLVNDRSDCLYKSIAKLSIDLRATGIVDDELIAVVDEIIAEINLIEELLTEKSGYKLDVDREIMENIYFVLLTGDNAQEKDAEGGNKYQGQDTSVVLAEMKDSLNQILAFAEFPKDRSEEITCLIRDFGDLKDKLSGDDKIRLLRKRITEAYYQLYEKVFIKAYDEKNVSKPIDLFLKYGFIDENLLTNEQMIDLYYLKDENNQEGPCHVYNMKEWLTAIYEGTKEPSKSEFDLDYTDNLREMKRTQNISQEEEREYLANPYKKLNYEIKNMFRYNNRLVNGQISIFVPILFGESFINSIQKTYQTTDMVNQAVKDLLTIDFSVFHREVLYYDESKGIKKEYIMKQVYPDIILMPMVGYNSVMWQEITGKKRDTSGRFLLPVFNSGELNDMIIKLFGRFRWELCRTIQGASWNNISDKSLTSEYVDYIQFYRKNRELTEERKEKLKIQIQKGKNNSREIFLMDYIIWVKNEYQGAIKLNKLAREIIATYCPFIKEKREKLAYQPLFEDAMARYHREKIKKVKEFETRIRLLQKEGIQIPNELLDTQSFYNDF